MSNNKVKSPFFSKSSVFLMLLIISLYSGYALAEPVSPWDGESLDNAPAPPFDLKTTAGGGLSLASLKGKVVLLNFWAVWCPPCKDEMPSMNKLYETFRDKGFVVVAVSHDKTEEIKQFMSTTPIKFPMLTDPKNALARDYKVFMLPTSYLINKNGIIVKRYFGAQEWMDKNIQEDIRKLL